MVSRTAPHNIPAALAIVILRIRFITSAGTDGGQQTAGPAPVKARNLVLDRAGPGKPVPGRPGSRVPVPHQPQTLQQPALAAQHEVRIVDRCLPLDEHRLVRLVLADVGPVAAVPPLLLRPPVKVGKVRQRTEQRQVQGAPCCACITASDDTQLPTGYRGCTGGYRTVPMASGGHRVHRIACQP